MTIFVRKQVLLSCGFTYKFHAIIMKILAVCLGNICRSPLAEGLLRREIEERGLDWEVASGGTARYHIGKPPDPRSQAVARDNGIDISAQRSHQVTVEDLEYYDIIFAMDRQNAEDLKARALTEMQRGKVKLFLEFAGIVDTEGADVFDPYYDDNAYTGVFTQVERAARLAA